MTHLKSCQYFADGLSMKRTPTEFQFIMITLLLVAMLGVPTAYSLIDEDISQELAVAEPNKQDEQAAGDRSPASVSTKLGHAKSSLFSMTNLDLSCAQSFESSFKVVGQFVQFKGKNCLKNFKQDHIEIVNKSNGYTASIFSFGKDQYQTDMIQLMGGENEITIRYNSPAGTKYEKTIKVLASTI